MAIANLHEQSFYEKFVSRLNHALQEEAEAIFDRKLQEAVHEVQKKRAEIIGRVGVELSQELKIESMGQEIVITIVKK